MTSLFQSWKESLSLFYPKNARLFFLVTAKTVARSYKYIFFHLWWLFVLFWLANIPNYIFMEPRSDLSYLKIAILLTLALLANLLLMIIIFGFYLIIRPSIKSKSLEYYTDYLRYFPTFIFYTILVWLISAGIMFSLLHIFFTYFKTLDTTILFITNILYVLLIRTTFAPLYYTPLFIFCFLFYLDSDGSFMKAFSSIIRGFKMLFYNVPFCIIIVGLLFLSHLIIEPILFDSQTLYVLLLPIPMSIFTNFYTKRIHDQFGLYYPETIKE